MGQQQTARNESARDSESRHSPDEAFGFEEDRFDGAEERACERLDGEGGLEVRGGAPTIFQKRQTLERAGTSVRIVLWSGHPREEGQGSITCTWRRRSVMKSGLAKQSSLRVALQSLRVVGWFASCEQ